MTWALLMARLIRRDLGDIFVSIIVVIKYPSLVHFKPYTGSKLNADYLFLDFSFSPLHLVHMT